MDTSNNNYLDLVLSMFNQYVFQDCKNNIQDIILYYKTNPATSNNKLVEELLVSIKDYTLDNIGLPLFNAILAKAGKNSSESQDILNRIIKFKTYTRSEMEPARKYIRDIVASVYLQKAGRLFGESPSDYLTYLKGLEFKSGGENYLSITKFGNLDINSIVAEHSEGGIPSKFEWINDTFKPERTYPKRGLHMVVARPGSGKTLFAMQECLNMALHGYKTHYLCMGDMTEEDFIVRMCAMYFGVPFSDVKDPERINLYYRELREEIGENLDITVIPASTITVDDYIEFIKDKPYDACFIDYDSQFKSTVHSESMYLVYGDIYAKLSTLTVEYKKLVWILAQPMKQSWALPVVEIDQVGESARKIHAVDWCITRGVEPGNLNGLGTFKIVKSRRGDENVVDYNIRLNNGRFKSLPKQVFEDIKAIDKKMYYSEADIDSMIRTYNQAMNNARNGIQQAQQQKNYGGKPGNLPF